MITIEEELLNNLLPFMSRLKKVNIKVTSIGIAMENFIELKNDILPNAELTDTIVLNTPSGPCAIKGEEK